MCTHTKKKFGMFIYFYNTYLLKARFSLNCVAVCVAVTSARLETHKPWRKWVKPSCYAKWISEQ